jgi:hypothetical protein
MWISEAMMKYPKQWIVMVNVSSEPQTYKTMGDVYRVTSDKKEAYDLAIELGDSLGHTTVIEGFDDRPQIGGFTLSSR